MNTIRTAALVAALATASASSLGQENTAPPPASTAPPPASTAPPATETPAPPPTEERGVVKDGEFIPTQELSADEEVTFPVDI
jgi:hypothetical protein